MLRSHLKGERALAPCERCQGREEGTFRIKLIYAYSSCLEGVVEELQST